MKCPACKTEMRYFKEYDPPRDGYRCSACGSESEIPVVDISEDVHKKRDRMRQLSQQELAGIIAEFETLFNKPISKFTAAEVMDLVDEKNRRRALDPIYV